MASAMKGRGPGLAAVLVVVCVVVVLALASCVHASRDASGKSAGQVQQTTHLSTAKKVAFGQQLFQCPCSYQYCDGDDWNWCTCNINSCSCVCHNSAEAKIPEGATVQVLPSP